MSVMRVLYIEDNPANLRLVESALEAREDITLEVANTAEDGLRSMQKATPELILLDINLPGMDGYQALRLLKSDPRTASIPVVAVSANAMQRDRERALSSGAAEYLTKPFDMREFYALIESYRP